MVQVKKMKPKIVFLDVDGPLIPTGMYFINPFCSAYRMFSPIPIALVGNLLEGLRKRAEFGDEVYLVMNTMHNYLANRDNGTYVKEDLIVASSLMNINSKTHGVGIKEEFFHKNWRTNLGNHQGIVHGRENSTSDRMAAIKMWAEQNYGDLDNIDWVCFDDENFTQDKRLILIDFDKGIGVSEWQKAFHLFGQNPPVLY